MNNAPLDHRLIIERLERVSELQIVGTAADYAAVKGLTGFRAPSAYALLARESSVPNPTGNSAGRVRQMIDVTFGIVIAVRNYSYSDAEAADALGPILSAVRSVIVGWTPPQTGARPCQFVTGQALDSDSSTLLWGEVYSTQHSIGSTS